MPDKYVTFKHRIVYGTVSRLMEMPDDIGNTHEWKLFVRPVNDLVSIFDTVEFYLHESFPNPFRLLETSPFEINEKGWGEFEIKIVLICKHVNTPLTLYHLLKLHCDHTRTNDISIRKDQEGRIISEYYDEIVLKIPQDDATDLIQSGALDGFTYNNIPVKDGGYNRTDDDVVKDGDVKDGHKEIRDGVTISQDKQDNIALDKKAEIQDEFTIKEETVLKEIQTLILEHTRRLEALQDKWNNT